MKTNEVFEELYIPDIDINLTYVLFSDHIICDQG